MMIGQTTAFAYVRVKTEPRSPLSAAKMKSSSSSAHLKADNVAFDHDYLSNNSSPLSYRLSQVIQRIPSPVSAFSTVPPGNPQVPKAVTNLDIPDNTSNYSPISSYSTALVESEQPSKPTTLPETRRNLATVTSPNPIPTCEHYEYPRYYFEALIDDAQIRYDKASEFFVNMRTYSTKCEVYATILHDLFLELGKPPPDLDPELYKRLARLRRSIRHLELKMASRCPRMTGKPSLSSLEYKPIPGLEIGEKSASDLAPVDSDTNLDVTSNVQETGLNKIQDYCWRQTKMKEMLEEKIRNLAEKERELRQERHQAEAELNYLFGVGAAPNGKSFSFYI